MSFPFHTPVELPTDLPRLSQEDELLLLGSCFATNIGQRLLGAKFRLDLNPYGTLYNPLSISTALREVADGTPYTIDRLFCYRGCWHSPMHHSDFSSPDPDETLERINRRLLTAHRQLVQSDCLLLTFGTAWVYEELDSGRIVGNCHRLPESCFRRRCLSVDEITADYTALLTSLLTHTPGIRVILTVSPIRHVRDGMHANTLSKATLQLAIAELQQAFPEHVFYFPAAEILLDELRDYRFYATDMVHPSDVAVDYIWQCFVQACLSPRAIAVMTETDAIRKALEHKPFHPHADEYKRFLGQIVLKIDQLNRKYPYLDFQNERELCRTRLNI